MKESLYLVQSFNKGQVTVKKLCGGKGACYPCQNYMSDAQYNFALAPFLSFFSSLRNTPKPCTSLVSLRLLATPFVPTRLTLVSLLVLLPSLLLWRVSNTTFLFCFALPIDQQLLSTLARSYATEAASTGQIRYVCQSSISNWTFWLTSDI